MCTKLNITNNYSNVMLYLKLREEGCEKDQARQFCRKNFCKIDSTQNSIGPPGHKVLKILPNRLQGEKGWMPGFMMKYDLGSGFKDSKDMYEESTQAEKAILKQYLQYEKKKNAALLQKMLAVKNYAQSMEPPKIDVFSKNSIERIRKISEELRDNQQKPKKYYELGDLRLYALAEYVGTQRQGPVSDLNLNFDPVLNQKTKCKTEKQSFLTPTRSLKRQGTFSNMTKEANFILQLQSQTPVSEDLDTRSTKIKEPLLTLNHQKIDLAEEFNSSQYLFTPSNSHTRQPSQIDQNDDAVKCFVQQFYDKQYNDKNILPPNLTKRNIRLRTLIKDEQTERIKKSTHKMKTSSM